MDGCSNERLWVQGLKVPENITRSIIDWVFPNGNGSSARHQSRPDAIFVRSIPGRPVHLDPSKTSDRNRGIHLVESKFCSNTNPFITSERAAAQHAHTVTRLKFRNTRNLNRNNKVTLHITFIALRSSASGVLLRTMGLQRALAVLAVLAIFAGVSKADDHDDKPINFLDYLSPEGRAGFSTFKGLYNAFADMDVKDALNGTGVDYKILVPNNTAFDSFFLYLKVRYLVPEFVNEVLKNHVIKEYPVEGTNENKTFATLAMNEPEVRLVFNENGEVVMAEPLDSPAVLRSMGIVFPFSFNTSAPGNSTVYFVNSVMLSQTVFDAYIGKAAPSLYAAVEKLSEEGAEVSLMLDTLNTDAAFAVKSTLSTTNGTLFVPNNAAVTELLNFLNVHSFPDLLATEGLRKMLQAILLHHFVPNDVISDSTVFPQSVTSALSTLEYVGDNDNLRLVSEGGNLEILHRDPYQTSSINATVVGLNSKYTTTNGYEVGVYGSETRGRVHIIDKVMLPIPGDGVGTLADFASSAPSNQTYDTFRSALEVVGGDARDAVYGPKLRGVVFMPSDAAFQQLLQTPSLAETGLTLDRLLETPSLVEKILHAHVILDNVIQDSGSYTTLAGVDVNVTLDNDGYITKFGRTSGPIDGFPNEAKVDAYTEQQTANGHIAQSTYGGLTASNGRIFFVDQVIISRLAIDTVVNLVSPAGDSWKLIAPGGAENFSITDFILPQEIRDLFGGGRSFVGFLPNNQAFSSLANDAGVEVTNLATTLESNGDLTLAMLNSYIVMDETDLAENTPYDTRLALGVPSLMVLLLPLLPCS
ncbi:hypothetical protein DUNSADRAFT_2770 [Dunaliella salina]|uniref:FAS1 domain-containing protein n=1 Tax=Dunaliella salina TaxID=3046 RepID=A0ABQ7GV52_DUNSA|nr:hypothetical protein DUNSADRAFT_2770 [Dunaliella salina]|eukprot:KAF5838499.1 hypothetical protein DUNSADRAFT_2770 [Dunaliella salina]